MVTYLFDNLPMLIGYCQSSLIPYGASVTAFEHRLTYDPLTILPSSVTAVCLAIPVQPHEDLYLNKHYVGTFKGYNGVYLEAEKLVLDLQSQGFSAVLATKLDVKATAILCGLGVRAKNSMVIHPDYGTRLRFAVVLTDYVPEAYSEPLLVDLCTGCAYCVDNCHAKCFNEGKLDVKRCYKSYLPTRAKLLSGEYAMCNNGQAKCPYNP